MIRRFIAERRSWILFFLFQLLILLFIAYLDPSISLSAMSYIVFLSLVLFIFFLFLRYQRETAFFKQLEERVNDLDLSSLTTSRSPFETIVEKSIIEQTEHLKQTASRNRVQMEQEKDEMLSWIHEVKTPLTALHLMIQRMEDDQLKARLTYEWLRIHLLLDQQLHQKRIPFIENDLYMEDTDIETLLFTELKTLQSWCIQKGIGFDFDLQVTHVLSDSKWLAFIIRQILTNAVKYSESSDIIIRSYLKADRTFLDITDHGRGIDSRDLSRIFDKGFTSTTVHHDQASTGMGLYLAKKAADSLHIKMSVNSKVNYRTTFTLAFPRKNEFVHIIGM
ncbi:HAMP domain-containing histidine kinase [Peribacillus cavernae]|uniref:histidine kinase n=1 Tax=Peribacillus cavernae TaxID=1674310 RepID=A0A433HB87_9BACI|nr:sensor histidine kinase [Peribacillus cavernae]MDQ0220384.1 OmpR family two-component system bacitracin resistance sensor histidine kinase BceS [Peribacillus cavernae]RUQ25528.1 HAMP domain-containing histidine kinase [Peribacillus cavernae]